MLHGGLGDRHGVEVERLVDNWGVLTGVEHGCKGHCNRA
jgi:hypothetical protein